MKQLKANMTLSGGKPYLRLIAPNTVGACTTAHDATGEWSLNFPAGTFPPDRTFVMGNFKSTSDDGLCWGIKQNGDAQIKITAISFETGEPVNYLPEVASILIEIPDSDYGAIQ